MTKIFRDNCDLWASFSRGSNSVKNVLFRSFCTPIYAPQLRCNFRKSYKQRMRVAYNCGWRALYNLPRRASVSSHYAQCNIPTFEALLLKMRTCFSKDAESLTAHGHTLWCRLFIFVLILWTLQSHFTLWMSARTLHCLFVRGVLSCHNTLVLYLALTSLGISGSSLY